MKEKAIYIICCYSGKGRAVLTASTGADDAAAFASRYAESLTAEGWRIEERQIIADDAQLEPVRPGTPSVVEVYHLKDAAGGWQNVELYRITEDITTKNERR